MKEYSDFEGKRVRLTVERLAHILEHPEMTGMEPAIGEALSRPERVLESLSDSEARLYYRFYVGTRVGDKYLCVVVKIQAEDAFVITAYLTNTFKKGMQLWPKES